MYVQDWDIFAEQAEALYRSDPLRVRYVLKYRHCDGKAVLKVTDDKTARPDLAIKARPGDSGRLSKCLCVQALQYKTDQIADIKKIEKLNLLLFTLMSQGSDAEIPVVEPMDTPAPPPAQEPVPKTHSSQQSTQGQKRRKG